MMKVILKRGKEKIAQLKHHWIFSGAIASYPKDVPNGSVLPFYSDAGEFLGHAYFNFKTSLAGRIISFGSEPFEEALKRHILQAFKLREAFFDKAHTNAYRLINAEGDYLPGLIVDRYNDILVIQIGTLGMEKLKPLILPILNSLFPWRGIYEKSLSSSRKEEGLAPCEAVLQGTIPDTVEILENDLSFLVPIKKGQKTGFFLDQKQMRALVASLSKNKKVLNAFSYTGGFTVAALKGGALSCDSVDISSEAHEIAKKNCALNALRTPGHFFTEDVFSFLRDKTTLDYDLVILDPPAFAKKKEDVDAAIKGYKEINSQALSKMHPGSLLLTFSCSYFIDDATFRTTLFHAARKAQKEVKILSSHHQSPDHPINLFHRESAYLKGYLLEVS